MIRRLIIFLVLLLIVNTLNAQCSDKLVETAIKNAGLNTIFVREFKLKTDTKKARAKSNTFQNTKTFEVRLNEGYLYRLNVENELESQAVAILQLFDENLLLGTTYNTNTQQNERYFDFYCNESKNYNILFSFKDNKTGCAAGALSIVLTDSSDIERIKSDLSFENVLYTGIDNYLNIVVTEPVTGIVNATISDGIILKENGLYKIQVAQPGKVVVTVETTDSIGKQIEISTTEFVVIESLPQVLLSGKTGGIISKHELNFGSIKLTLENIPENMTFKITNFSIADKLYNQGINAQLTETLNYRQMSFLKSLNSGDSFFVKDINIQNNKGVIYKLQPMGFIIE